MTRLLPSWEGAKKEVEMTYVFSSFANPTLLSQDISYSVFSPLDYCCCGLTGLSACCLSLSSILALSRGDPSKAQIPVIPTPPTLDLFPLLAG